MFVHRNIARIVRQSVSFSTVAETKPSFDLFRTNENQVAKQTLDHEAKYYTLPQEIKKQLFLYGGFPRSFDIQVKTFGEPCLMIRRPALELIHFLNNTDFSKPVTRYVLYGDNGTGKSLTLAHLLHYGSQNGFLLVHVPWVPNWFKRPKETANSHLKEGFIDLPLDAASWLIHFKMQNSNLLAQLNLICQKDYEWSKREKTPKGATLMELIDHGINRVKYASEVISVLLDELKSYANQDKCKIMVGIDGYNAFYHQHTRIFTDNKVRVMPDKITLTNPFIQLTDYNWKNGVCILTVDKIAMTDDHMESPLPFYLLGREGFEYLSPFVPIRVDGYTEKEINNCIQYYLDRRWIQNTAEGFDTELKFLSGYNPYKLQSLCASL